jgi:hypothetical protein
MPSAFCSGWKGQTQIVRTAWVCKRHYLQIDLSVEIPVLFVMMKGDGPTTLHQQLS